MNYFKKLINWFFPYTCVFCKMPSHREQNLCHACWHDLPILHIGCVRCANHLPQADKICGQCLQVAPMFDCAHALFTYHPPITKLILDLKFHRALAHAQLLGEWMRDKIIHDWYREKPRPSVIIPVPLHPKRLKERGFNQALEIARPIAKTLDLPILTRHITRRKHTIAQTALPAKTRKHNMRHAFLIQQDLKNQHVAVLDDVMTTGHTLNEFCRVLKQNGAGKIDVWCCARAGK